MIVDSSAIMAIVLNEPERATYIQTILRADRAAMSAGTWLELGVVAARRRDEERARLIEQFVNDAGIAIEPVTAHQAQIGRQAYRAYGQTASGKAKLNFGDCFAYALAKATGEPLLFKGDDFIHTDITPAL